MIADRYHDEMLASYYDGEGEEPAYTSVRVRVRDVIGCGTVIDVDGPRFLLADEDGIEDWFTDADLAELRA